PTTTTTTHPLLIPRVPLWQRRPHIAAAVDAAAADRLHDLCSYGAVADGTSASSSSSSSASSAAAAASAAATGGGGSGTPRPHSPPPPPPPTTPPLPCPLQHPHNVRHQHLTHPFPPAPNPPLPPSNTAATPAAAVAQDDGVEDVENAPPGVGVGAAL